jgi:hypothetical protein
MPLAVGGRPSTRRLSKIGFGGASDVMGELYLADNSIPPSCTQSWGSERVRSSHRGRFCASCDRPLVVHAQPATRSGHLTELLDVLAHHEEGRWPLTRRRSELLRAAGSNIAGGEHAGL